MLIQRIVLCIIALILFFCSTKLALLVERPKPVAVSEKPMSWFQTVAVSILAVLFLSGVLWVMVKTLSFPAITKWVIGAAGISSALKLFFGFKYKWQFCAVGSYILVFDDVWLLWPNLLTANLYAVLLAIGISLTPPLQTSFTRLSFVATFVAICYDYVHVYGTGLMLKGIGTIENNHLPALIIIPKTLSLTAPRASAIGIGDIVIPAILAASAVRIGYKAGHTRYLWASVVGYAFGLGLTVTALYVLRTSQPALIYLIPSVVVAVMLTAWRTNEFHLLRQHGAAV